MPSRRKCAHTTKIERVPRYEVYHGEEDLDERLGSDGTLDLSIKRIKVEPPDSEKNATTTSSKTSHVETESRERQGAHCEDVEMESSPAAASGEESASPRDEAGTFATELNSEADDACAHNDKSDDRLTAQASAPSEVNVVLSAASEQLVITSNGQTVNPVTGLPLFPTSNKGKPVRPFKLYTSNRDLLSGFSTQGAPSLATYSVPVALAAVPGAVPLAFATVPLVTGAPMIPVTASSSATSATTSAAATGAGSATTCTSSTSSSTTNASAKSTSSTTDVHLMTLATEADKILRERHASGESSTGMSSDTIEGNTAENYSSSGDDDTAMLLSEDGTVLKIPSVSGKGGEDSDGTALTFIQKRAVAAAVAATNPPKNKKKRQSLPDQMKDIAYWERRRKNNEAAKRSRDARRAKEDQIAIRAALLEQENIRLKIEVTQLKEETAKLRSMLYSNNNS